MKRITPFLAGLALFAFAGFGPAIAGGKKVVVELFTSQGCSSCPPAEAFLTELAKRDNIIALEFHVDYWNYLGWKDPFSSKEYTQRQNDFVRRMGKRYVYTPQMVMNGWEEAVGSRRGLVLDAIEKVRKHPQIDVSVAVTDKKTATVRIGMGKRQFRPATVWLFAIDRQHKTKIPAGENSGRVLVNSNVVREVRKLGTCSGRDKEIKLPLGMMGLEKQDSCVIVVQQEPAGRILGAVQFALARQ